MKELKIFLSALVLLLAFASCDEKEEIGEFDNWKERNIHFVDSIATVARNSTDGAWKVVLAEGLDSSKEWPNEFYVYCNVLTAGSGVSHPAFTDTVSVNYRGCLMPTAAHPFGYIFDSSYDGEFDPLFDVPVSLPLSGTVSGFYTAVQQMVAGDTWRVYIPYELGYGTSSSSSIPAYSTLVFDINLVSFRPARTAVTQ